MILCFIKLTLNGVWFIILNIRGETYEQEISRISSGNRKNIN